MRSISRVVGVSINTVTKLLVDAGLACAAYHDRQVRNVWSKRVQCDEVWAFCGAKAKNVSPERRAMGDGDVWTWTGLDADSKLMISWTVGARDSDSARVLMDDLASRLAHKVQLTTDGHTAYLRAVDEAFGPGSTPEFDLIVLGIGPDVHCASLFPNNPELGIKDRAVAGVEQPGMAPLVPRITLTLPTLNAGARVVFLVSGEEKAEAVARAFNSRPGPDAPASLVQPRGECILLCDAAAAAHL